MLSSRMLKKGAYSKKYQQLERERMRCMREGEKGIKRNSKDRAHILSKQTAQRQRALEQKKHAMALAEEERRKKALEERRRAQQEATERFKSAIGRLRSASKSTSKSGEMNVEIYVPKNTAVMRPSAQKGSVKVWERSTTVDGERIAIGREVEVTSRNGHMSSDCHRLERRTPSLDDVLRSIRGGRKEIPGTSSHEIATSSETAMPVRRRDSDTSLAVPIYQAKMLVSHANPPPEDSSVDQSCGSDLAEKPLPDKTDTINENMVFQPVLKRLPNHEQDSGDDIQILSPDSATSPTDSLCESGSSTELQDSLERAHLLGSSRRVQIELQQKQQKAHRRAMSKRRSQNGAGSHAPDAVTDSAPLDKSTLASSHPQLQRYAARANTSALNDDSDSSSSTDSLRCYSQPRPTPPRSRRHGRDSSHRATPSARRNLNPGGQEWNREAFEIKNANAAESKIVGILKKPDSRCSQQDSKSSFAASTACPSHASSAAGSMLIADVGHGGGESEIASQSNTNEGGTRALKRVRFVDQVEPSKSRVSQFTTVSNIPLDSARIELWKKVLPNGFSSHFLPNSAFTPRMKISLSSKGPGSVTGSNPTSSPPNGLVVHVPKTTESSSSPECRSPEMKNSEKSNSAVSSPAVPHFHTGNQLKDDHISESLAQSGKNSSVNKREGTTSLNGRTGELNGCSDTGECSKETSTDEPRKLTSLEKTPTDDDINELWDQIRSCLHTNEKVTVPPQVFNFKPPPEDANHTLSEGQRVFVTLPTRQQQQLSRQVGSGSQQKHAQAGSYAQSGSQKQLVHRQPNRPLRCHSELHQMQLRRRQSNPHAHTYEPAHAAHRLQQDVKDPEFSVSATGSGAGRKALTTLSIEEQRLLLSIERLNQKLRDKDQHSPATISEYHHPPDSSPPKRYHPPTNRVWGAGDLPKTRVRRHPKTVALAAAMKAEALDSWTQVKSLSLTHRQFYNA